MKSLGDLSPKQGHRGRSEVTGTQQFGSPVSSQTNIFDNRLNLHYFMREEKLY